MARDAFALADRLPSRYAGLAKQLRSCSESVASNISEGNDRPSNREVARYLVMALGSLQETESRLLFMRVANLAPRQQIDATLTRVGHVDQLLTALLRSLDPPS